MTNVLSLHRSVLRYIRARENNIIPVALSGVVQLPGTRAFRGLVRLSTAMGNCTLFSFLGPEFAF